MLVSAGYLNAIAIMGDTLSEEQVELLHTEYGAGERVTLFWPTHADVVPTLSALLWRGAFLLTVGSSRPPTAFSAFHRKGNISQKP